MDWSGQRMFWQLFMAEAAAVVSFAKTYANVHGQTGDGERSLAEQFSQMPAAEKSRWVPDNILEELRYLSDFAELLEHVRNLGGFLEPWFFV